MAASLTAFRYSWGSMLRTSRAAVAVLVLGELALTVPPETRDMLAFLDAGHLGAALKFQIALFVLGASAWYWSRAALAARFGIGDEQRTSIPGAGQDFDWFAYMWFPRLLLIGAFLGGAVMALEGRSPTMAVGALVVGAALLLAVIVRPRSRTANTPAPRNIPLASWHWRYGAARLWALLRHAPYGAWVSAVLLAAGLVPLALGLVQAFGAGPNIPNIFASYFPGPASAVLLLGLMIGPLVATTFVFDGVSLMFRLGRRQLGLRRPPVLVVLFLYVFVAVPAIFEVHTVRLLDPGPVAKGLSPRDNREALDNILDTWVKICAPGSTPIRPIIVAISGGATRAGIWGMAVLDQVLQAQSDYGPKLFAISSVSGGSLGAAGAMAYLSMQPSACSAHGLDSLRPDKMNPVPLAGDALGPLLAGWLLNDIPRSAFDPVAASIRTATKGRPNGGDSAEAIEQGFADLWAKAKPASAQSWPSFNAPFLSLFYKGGAYVPGMPLWFANGTDAGTGNRVITGPIKPPTKDDETPAWPFRGARDFYALTKSDVRIATAINNTARFPYLEPSGEALDADKGTSTASIVDGGYFENEGLQTALDLAEWLANRHRADGRAIEPIIVEATGDGEATVTARDVMTCDQASDSPDLPDTEHGAWQLIAPLVGLYHVRGGHSAVLLRQAHDLCQSGKLDFFHFYLPADHERSIPLNWVLSDATARFIWSAVNENQQVHNASELARLRTALRASGS